MIKNIVFDLGNVIIKWDPEYIVSQYIDDIKEQQIVKKALFGSKYWLDYDAGAISRDDLVKKVNETLETKYHLIVKEMIHEWYKHAPVINGIEELIKNLKEKGYNIYLLSNTNVHFDEYKDTINCLKYFDGYYISAIKKLVKPSKEIYFDFFNEFNLIASQSVFIDDSKANIDGSNSVGMKGYVFDGDVSKLKKFLQTFKIL